MSDIKTNPPVDEEPEEKAAVQWPTDEAWWDAVLEGVPKSPPGWWDLQPGEDAIAYMFRVFLLARTH
jgi:hypothetical protein